MGRGAGNLPLYYEGEWDPTVPYLPREVVKRKGEVYLAIAKNTNVIPGSDPTVWLPFGGDTAPSWFTTAGALPGQVLTASGWNDIIWDRAITDGVAAGTDFTIDGTHPERLVCHVAGTYLITMNNTLVLGAGGVRVRGYVALNDDSVGPGYWLNASAPQSTDLVLPTFPLVLAVGDYLRYRLDLDSSPSTGTLQWATAVMLRIA